MSLINQFVSYYNFSQCKQVALSVSNASTQDHYEINEINKTLKELIKKFNCETIKFAKQVADSKTDGPPKKKRRTSGSELKIGTLLSSLRNPKQGSIALHLGNFSKEMVNVFEFLTDKRDSFASSSEQSNFEISVDRHELKTTMLKIYKEFVINLEIIGSHHINSSNFTKAKDYYDTAQKFCEVIEDIEKENSKSEDNPSGRIFFDSALIKLQIEFNQAILDRECSDFKEAKKKLRHVIKLCEDLSQTELIEEFSIWANQAADVYMQILDQESPLYSDQAKVIRKWMSLERVPESLRGANLHRIKVLTNLGVLLKNIETKSSSKDKSPLDIINKLQEYIKKNPNNYKNSKGAYAYFEKKGDKLNCTSEVVNQLINQLITKPNFPQLPLNSQDAFMQANVLLDHSRFSEIKELKTIIKGNASDNPDKKMVESLDDLSRVKLRMIERVIPGTDKKLSAVRFYPRSKTSDQVFVNKCTKLGEFCEDHNINIKPKKEVSRLAQIDFSLLADVAYESSDELPAFYNLLLWWFDDKYIDELDAKSDNLELITNYISQMQEILYAESVEEIDSDDTELVKIAKKVKTLLIDRQITPQNSPGFFERTFETFSAQLEQAQRKQLQQILTPEEFYSKRLQFSGVWPSLELALSLLSTNKQKSTQPIVENSLIKLLWEKVNWLVSIDNCWDSSIKEIFKEKDPENYVFVKYVNELISKHPEKIKDKVTDYFDDLDYDLLQGVIEEVAAEANNLLFEIREMLDCFPEEFKDTDKQLALKVGAQWVKALDWSKRTVRYYLDINSSKHEQCLMKQRS